MNTTVRRILLAIVFIAIFWVIWDRVHIIVFMRGLDLLILLGVLGALFLVIDHFLNRERK